MPTHPLNLQIIAATTTAAEEEITAKTGLVGTQHCHPVAVTTMVVESTPGYYHHLRAGEDLILQLVTHQEIAA